MSSLSLVQKHPSQTALPGGSHASGQATPAEPAVTADTPRGTEPNPATECASPVRSDRPVSSPGTPDPAQGDSQYAHLVFQGSESHGKSEVPDLRDSAQGDPQHASSTMSDKIDQDGSIHVQSDESEPDGTSSEASEASGTSAKTVDSSNCDPHKPEAAPGL